MLILPRYSYKIIVMQNKYYRITKTKVGKDKFKPQRILDIGYGPATGIVALNEIMGNKWVPEEKEAYIVGRKIMK